MEYSGNLLLSSGMVMLLNSSSPTINMIAFDIKVMGLDPTIHRVVSNCHLAVYLFHEIVQPA